jgi:hypothetical protein
VATALAESEVADLARRAQAGDVAARDRLAAAHVGLVWRAIFSNFVPESLERDDLVQEGVIAMFRAIGKYDASKGARFSTYATFAIRRHFWEVVAQHLKFPVQRHHETLRRIPARPTSAPAIVLPLSRLERWVLELRHHGPGRGPKGVPFNRIGEEMGVGKGGQCLLPPGRQPPQRRRPLRRRTLTRTVAPGRLPRGRRPGAC